MFRAYLMLGEEKIPFDFDVPASKKQLFYDMDHIECMDGLFMASGYVEKFVRHFYSPFDWALPQSFWDEYYKKHGEGPRGIWSYNGPERHLFGDFVSRDEYMRATCLYVSEAYKAGHYFDVKERKLT